MDFSCFVCGVYFDTSYLTAMSLLVISGLDLVTVLAAAESPIASTTRRLAIKYQIRRRIRFPPLIMDRENT